MIDDTRNLPGPQMKPNTVAAEFQAMILVREVDWLAYDKYAPAGAKLAAAAPTTNRAARSWYMSGESEYQTLPPNMSTRLPRNTLLSVQWWDDTYSFILRLISNRTIWIRSDQLTDP